MAAVEVKNLVKRFGNTTVVENLSVKVEKGEILALLGASGCGKTTTLRCIAGLEEPTSGEIWIDGRLVAGGSSTIPSEKRGIGMIFQSYAIWPHMTVFQNVAYGLRVKGMNKAAIRDAVGATLKTVMLDGLAERYPSELSGGQQQRVALARSIITEPAVLLLDEPLSNLDAKLREQMRDELREIIKRVGITAIHITHDQIEAMAIADRIGIMKDGVILQEGTARELYRRPQSRFIADFVGETTFLTGIVTKLEGSRMLIMSEGGLPMWSEREAPVALGDIVSVSVRPESVILDTAGRPAGMNSWTGTIEAATFLGSEVDYRVRIGGDVLRVRSRIDLEVGEDVDVAIETRDVVVLPAEIGKTPVAEAGELALSVSH